MDRLQHTGRCFLFIYLFGGRFQPHRDSEREHWQRRLGSRPNGLHFLSFALQWCWNQTLSGVIEAEKEGQIWWTGLRFYLWRSVGTFSPVRGWREAGREICMLKGIFFLPIDIQFGFWNLIFFGMIHLLVTCLQHVILLQWSCCFIWFHLLYRRQHFQMSFCWRWARWWDNISRLKTLNSGKLLIGIVHYCLPAHTRVGPPVLCSWHCCTPTSQSDEVKHSLSGTQCPFEGTWFYSFFLITHKFNCFGVVFPWIFHCPCLFCKWD